MLNLIFKPKDTKCTCACCGYRTLPSNSMSEICPVCFWEESSDLDDDLFSVSNINHMMLYEAQENYKKFGCCNKKLLKHCRKPLPNEEKDKNWLSIQNIIENKYNKLSELIDEIYRLSELLKKTNAIIIYKNFKSLNEIDIKYDYERLDNFIEYKEDLHFDRFKNELLLKSILIGLCKKNINQLLKLFEEYYKKGICYYISWSIMLFVLVEFTQFKLNTEITDIFLDIENYDYYGIGSLEIALNRYWHTGSA